MTTGWKIVTTGTQDMELQLTQLTAKDWSVFSILNPTEASMDYRIVAWKDIE